jgi:hypothetical protein
MKENAFTHYNRDEVLYNRFAASCNAGKLPVLDNMLFESLNREYGKEKMRTHLADYIATERPVFPLKEISKDRVRECFYQLQKFDTSTICIPKEQVKKDVFEKYDDYKWPYYAHGLGLINGPNTFNDVSNYFHQDLRLECGSYGFRAPKEVWENGTAYDIWKCLGPIWRGINGVQKKIIKDLDGSETEQLLGGELDEKSYISAFRLGTYIATQFKPVVAKAIYDMTNAKTVLDTSCGWGDRLAGFFASNAEEYYGCDPNPNTHQRYQEQIAFYNKLLPKPKKVTIWRCGAENLPYHKLPEIDCAFTSPPYFATEEYNKGGEFEGDQSWHKFKEYVNWRDKFYLPVAENTMQCLSNGGWMLVNIMDPKIKGDRYRSSDELVEKLKDSFMGQIGMRIMQRPQGRKQYKTKEELNAFMAKMFIENIWVFRGVDSGTEEFRHDFDLFKNSRKATLDDFL